MPTTTPNPSPFNLTALFENTTGLTITFLTIIIGCYLFVYLPKQYEIKEKDNRRMGGEYQQQGEKEGNSVQGLKGAAVGAGVEKTASIMSPPTSNLSPPSRTPITTSQLAKHDGSNPSLPIYVAIKGDVFDVSAKKEMYGIGAGYNVFAGKDGSVGLGKSSLKPEDARPDYESLLEPAERKVLDQWYGFFEKRYNIVGKVSD